MARLEPIQALFIAPDLRVGGAERQWEYLLPEIRTAGIVPGVLTLKSEGPIFHRIQREGIRIQSLKWTSFYEIFRALTLIFGCVLSPPDVVIARGLNAHFAAWVLQALRKVPYIVAEHSQYDLLPPIGRRKLLLQWLARRATTVVVVAHSQILPLRRTGYRHAQIIVIPNGTPDGRIQRRQTHPNTLQQQTALEDDRNRLTFSLVASLRPEKRIDDFIRLVSKINSQNGNVRGIVAGGGKSMARLVALAEVCGSHVTVLGEVADLAAVWERTDVACLTSDHEAMPLSLIEAMSHGIPLLVTDVGSNRVLCSNGVNGYIHPVGDLSGMVKSGLQLANDPTLRAEMGQYSRMRYESGHTVQVMGKRYAKLIEAQCRPTIGA